MDVLLTSATGYIGGAVAKALQVSGHRVVGLARTATAAQRLEAAGISPFRGDLTDLEGLGQAAGQVDAVIHTAATQGDDMATVDRLAVEAILAALAGTEKPFLYTSGIWVMGDTGAWVADESRPVNPAPLVAWRPAIEELVLAAAADGVRSQVIRSALVYGYGGGLLAMLTQAGREQGAVPVIGAGDNAWSFVHVDDLAMLYVKAMEQAPAGSLLIGASGEAVPLRQVALAAAEAIGLGNSLQFLTLEAAREIWGPLADAMALDQWVSGDRAKHLLNWQPTAPSVLTELTSGSYRSVALAA
ncbi:MAG: NAD-dependent epimerase [Leptolyngbya sp.]|nr:MAG: NAD-dependent epimerase [Leptolyngbya sp.]